MVLKNRPMFCMVLVSVVILASLAWSHCQVPCGIYGDEARFEAIAEHIATVEKSIKQIEKIIDVT